MKSYNLKKKKEATAAELNNFVLFFLEKGRGKRKRKHETEAATADQAKVWSLISWNLITDIVLSINSSRDRYFTSCHCFYRS